MDKQTYDNFDLSKCKWIYVCTIIYLQLYALLGHFVIRRFMDIALLLCSIFYGTHVGVYGYDLCCVGIIYIFLQKHNRLQVFIWPRL